MSNKIISGKTWPHGILPGQEVVIFEFRSCKELHKASWGYVELLIGMGGNCLLKECIVEVGLPFCLMPSSRLLSTV